MMKKRLAAIVTAVMAVILAAVFLGSCSEQPTPEERGYTVKVTYDFNDGDGDGESTKRVFYYKPDTPMMKPGDSAEFTIPSRGAAYTVACWRRALLDDTGTPLRSESGEILTEDEVFDFATARATESMMLIAEWKRNPTVTIHVDGREPDVRAYTEGETVNRFSYMKNRRDDNGNVEYTFYDYYIDSGLTEKVSWPLVMGDGENIDIYTKWLPGDVLIIREASDLSKISDYQNKTIYLDADIDCSENKTGFPTLRQFSGKFMGNGHTLKNITKDVTLSRTVTGFGLFGEVKQGAEITDLTLENMTVSVRVTLPATYDVGLLATRVTGDAKITGLTFTGCSVTYEMLSSAEGAYLRYSKDTEYEGAVGSIDDGKTLEFTVTPESGKIDFSALA